MDTVKNVESEVRRHRLQYMDGPDLVAPEEPWWRHDVSCYHCCYTFR